MSLDPSITTFATETTVSRCRSRMLFWNAVGTSSPRPKISANNVAILISCLNLIALAVLPWTQLHNVDSSSSDVMIVPWLLLPAAILAFACYRTYRYLDANWKNKNTSKIGPYILKEQIGSGGMGEVYRAEHQLMKRECAIKLINRKQARDQGMRDCFEREAKATAQLTHWNTVEVYDYGTTDDGRFYYVMEYLQGVNLSEFVEQYGTMPAARVTYVLKQICEALYEAECVGLVHRDIKPSNIFLTERGRSYDVAKLLDFGLVQATTTEPLGLNKTSTKLRGSPAYMCPEQAVGLDPDCRGDLYSLGCVAYFLLTGRPPFVDENPIMLIVAHATTDVPTFDELEISVPRDLASVIMKCLARSVEDRYSSARELLADLERCKCCSGWSWKHADDWWNEHQPKTLFNAANEDRLQQLSRDTRHDTMTMDGEMTSSKNIDHEEATVIYEPAEVGHEAAW